MLLIPKSCDEAKAFLKREKLIHESVKGKKSEVWMKRRCRYILL